MWKLFSKQCVSNEDPSKKKPYDLIIVVDDCYCVVILSNSHHMSSGGFKKWNVYSIRDILFSIQNYKV